MQPIKIGAGTEVVKALANGIILHRGNPKSFHRLLAVSQIVHRAEDQLTLPSSIAGVDNLGHILPAHQLLEDIKLILLSLGNAELEGAGNNWQILHPPLGVAGVVHIGISKTCQMAKTPRYNILFSFHIAVMTG